MDHTHHLHHFNILIPSSILLASFLGSWHCVGMCGGFVTAVSNSIYTLSTYHIGRLLGYLSIGFLSGLIGTFLLSSFNGYLSWLATSLISFYLIGLGIRLFLNQKKPVHFRFQWLEQIYIKLFQSHSKTHSITSAFFVGLLSVFLPCGWLYAFILGCMSLKNPWQASMALGIFWLGTLPALTFSPALIRFVIKPIHSYLPRLSACLLIMVGFVSLLIRFI